jgi:ADP-ribose pyrophosphatase YjhB (NUDIX family)
MRLNPGVYDLWVFRRVAGGVEFLLLHTSQVKADRRFGGGRYWQIPSGEFRADETVLDAVDRELAGYGLPASGVWAGEHVYTIYNRRFDEMQIISVFAVETTPDAGDVRLNPDEHAEFAWLSYDAALERVHYRGLKDGLRSVHEYITGVPAPAAELRLR